MTDEQHDDLIARALRDLPVPDHRPSFWSDLDRALDAPAAPASEAPPDDPPVHRLDTGELPSVTALAPERTARRSRRRPVLAAAAAVVVLVGAVGLVLVAGGGDGDGDDDEAELADGQQQDVTTTAPEEATILSVPVPPETATTLAVFEGSAAEAVMAWLRAVGEGDLDAAAELTGPRTTDYLAAATDGVQAYLRESAEGYGAWIGAADLQVEEIPLGVLDSVGGNLTIVVVTGTNPGEGRDGPTTDVFPVVDRGDGWLVEHLAFDPSRNENNPIVQIPRVPNGQSGLGSMGPDEAVEVIVPAAGTVYFRVDDGPVFSRQTTGVGPNNDPYARYDPEGTLSRGEHQLVVIGLGDDGTIAYIGGPFTAQG